MSRFVINPLPNPPMLIFRAGNSTSYISIMVITNGATVWFSGDYNQLTTTRLDGNPGGWSRTGGVPAPGNIYQNWIDSDLYAITPPGVVAEIEVAQDIHSPRGAAYTPAGVWGDPLGGDVFGPPIDAGQVPGPDDSSIGQRFEAALETFFAPLRNLFGVLILLLLLNFPLHAASRDITSIIKPIHQFDDWSVLVVGEEQWNELRKAGAQEVAATDLNRHVTYLRGAFVDSASDKLLRHVIFHEAGHIARMTTSEYLAEMWASQNE